MPQNKKERIMLAAILEAPGKIGVREIDMPDIGPDEALLKVEAAALCGSDLRTLRHGNKRVQPPAIMGHEAAGLVMASRHGMKVVLKPHQQ